MPNIPDIEDIFGPPAAHLTPPTHDRVVAGSAPGSAPAPVAAAVAPFTPEFYETRVCPHCRERKAISKENWYRQSRWRNIPHEDEDGSTYTVREKVWTPSTYCRSCTNKMKAGQAKTRRWLSKQDAELQDKIRAGMRGECGVCRRQASHRLLTKAPIIVPCCVACHKVLEQSDYQLIRVRAGWFALYRHIADEERIRREVMERTDRASVPAHRFNPDAKDVYFSHSVCVSMEENWRGAMRWLQDKA